MKKSSHFSLRILLNFFSENQKSIFILLILLFSINRVNAQNVIVNPGAGSYVDLGSAFGAINAGTHTGAITIDIVGNTTETISAVLNASGTGAASYTSIIISPSGGVAKSISGAIVGHLIDLNGADNVTIDGLNLGGNSLTISNTSVGATSTIRYIGDANNNTIQKCTILGSTTSFGVVYFATGTTTGNDGNNINNCNITSAGANLPLNGIYSLGTSAAIDNSSNTINANNISDFFSATSISIGLNVNSFNSTWTITNNKIFQTALRTYTTANTHSGININSGDGYTITDNTIGYASSSATGVYTMTSTVATRFIGIALGVGTITSSVQGNNITAISLATSSGAATTNGIICGINITAGNVNIGNITPNIIGAASGTGAITATPTTTGGAIVGINSSSTGTILIQGNTIGSFTSTGATAAIAGAISGINISGAATSVSVINNTIGNATPDNMRGGTLGTTTGGTCNVTGINNTSSTMIAFNATGNTIQNLSAYTSGTSGFVRGIVFGSGTGVVTSGSVSNNTITNLKATSALTGYTSGATTIAGILLGTGNGMIVSGNTISNLIGLSALTTNIVVSGINLAGAQNTIVSENKIFGLSNAGTGTTATGAPVIAGVIIRSAGAGFPITIRNNMISLGNGQTTNTSIIGIMSNHGSTPDPSVDRIYFNSINIEGVAASGALPSACYNRGDLTATARTVSVDIKNNIFNNTRSGGTGSHYAIGNNINAVTSLTGWAANASNYNLLNANVATIGYWTTSQTFSGWQTASSSDLNSISGVAVNFINTATGDLHITTPYPSIVEGAGTNIPSVTIDYDGQTRASLSPEDIGADAGNFINSPSIVITPLSNICTTGARTLSSTITDPDGVPTSGLGLPVLYWKINGGAYTATTANYISGNQYNFTFGAGTVTGDVVSYYIVAQDNLANAGSSPAFGATGFTSNPPATSTPPTTPYSYTITATLSGTYTVGVGGNYTTLTAAVAAYNLSCLGGPVTFSLIDASYPSETFPIVISANAQASAINILTIKPTIPTTISGSSATSIINIDGGDYITIDGSTGTTSNTVCPVSNATRDLTITNTNAVTTAGIIWLGTNSGGNSVTNCTVRNCILSGASSITTIVGLGAGGTTIGTGGTNNDNISFINNDIRACQFGIYSAGASAVNKNQNLTVNQNFINNASPNNIGIGGIYSAFTNNITISGNTIGNIINTLSSDVNGINVGFGAVGGFSATTTGIADGASNVTISNNTIGVVTQSGTFSAAGIGLGNTISGTSLIFNNIIYGVASNGTSGDFSSGIVLGGGTGQVNVYNNTVSMQGTIPGATAATQASACFSITSATTSPVDLRNNIFTNTQLGNLGSTNRFMAIGLAYSSTIGNYVSLISDNNDLYASGAGPGTYMIASTGGIPAGTARTILADWQTETGRDLTSKNVLPDFISTTDFHLLTTPVGTNWCLNNAGINLPAVTNDFDCFLRSTPSDIGAFEFTPLGDAVSTPSSQSACSGSPISTILLTGTATSFNWTRDNTVAATGIATSGTGNISGTLTNTTASPVIVTFTITPVNASGCFGPTITATVTVNPNPTVTASSSPSPATVCAGTSVTLTGSGATTYTWTDGVNTPTDGVAFVPASSSTYTVTGTNSGCTSTATIVVTVNPLPSFSSLVSTNVTCNGAGNGTVIVTSGAPSPTFSINPTATQSPSGTFSGLIPNIYTITVSSNSCISTTTTTITQPTVLSASTSAAVFCTGGTTTISSLVTGGSTSYSYQWITGYTTSTVTLNPSKDNTIFEENTSNSNGAGPYMVAGNNGLGFKGRALMAFDLSTIPLGATINSASLTLNCSQTNGAAGAQNQSLHKLLQDWGEGTSNTTAAGAGAVASTGDATWLNAIYPGTAWSTIGGVFAGTASATTSVNAVGPYTWTSASMVTDVQNWKNSPATNFGWILKGIETAATQAKRYDSKENAIVGNRPLLTVNYTAPIVAGTSATLTNAVAGTYTLLVTDANGCTSSSVITITPNAIPPVTASSIPSPATVCAGGSVTLNGGGATTYTWTNGVNTPTNGVAFVPASSSTYTVTGTTAGCSSTATIAVTVNAIPTVTANSTPSPAIICAGGNVTLNGGGATTYTWTNGVNTPTNGVAFVPASSSTYTVTGTTAGCSSTATLAVTMNASPIVSGINATPSSICLGSSSTLSIVNPCVTQTGFAAAYAPANWTTIQTNSNGTVNTAGAPSNIVMTSSNGLSGSGTTDYSITIPSTCSGNVTFNWSYTTIDGAQWDYPQYQLNAGATSVFPGFNTAGGTTQSGTASIAVAGGDILHLKAYSVDNTGGSCTITVSNFTAPSIAQSPVWSGPATIANPTSSSTGVTPGSAGNLTYTVTVTDATGCTGTASTALTVNALPTVTATPATQTLCQNSSATVTGGGASTYTWSGGITNATPFAVISSATYTVTGTDANLCSNTATAVVNMNALPTVTATPATQAICQNANATVSGGGASSYTWSGGITNATPFAVTSSATYTVTGTDANLCTNTATAVVNMNALPTVTASPTTQTLCQNANATVTGGGASSYTWSGGITDATPFAVTSSATYTVTGTDANLCTNTATAVVNMNAAPTVTAGATPTTTCNNTVVTPTGSGASTYTWSGGLTDNTPFVATATATYTVTGTDGIGCSATSSVTVTVTPASGTLAPATSNQSQAHNDDFNVNYSDASCNLIATVDDGAGGNILGLTTATVNVDATAGVHNGQPFVRRWYQITPTSNGSADVILYINQADFNDYNASVTAPYLPLPTSGNNADPNIANIRITKNADAGLGNSPVVITPTVNWNGTYWELSFNTPSFSQFRIHSANPGNIPLPATITKFNGRKLSTSDMLTWTTASEQNNAYFNLQYATDGINFKTIAKVNSQAANGNSSSILNYSYEHMTPSLGHNYYRLEQVDIDNHATLNQQIVDLIWGSNGSTVSIYPNPTKDVLNIDLYTSKVQNTTVKVLDMSGRIIKQIQARSEAGMNQLSISLGDIASGIYTVQIFENDQLTQVSKVKKND